MQTVTVSRESGRPRWVIVGDHDRPALKAPDENLVQIGVALKSIHAEMIATTSSDRSRRGDCQSLARAESGTPEDCDQCAQA